MLKYALIAGVILTSGGIVAGCWPDDHAWQGSRGLVTTRTYQRRGPVVVLHGAERVRTADGRALATSMLLGADGYWVRTRAQYLTRDSLRGVKVVVLDRRWDEMRDRRTSTLLTRWIEEGGSVLVLASGLGPELRRDIGAGHVAAIDPAAFGAEEFVARLIDAAHWLDGVEPDVSPSPGDSAAPPLPSTGQSPGRPPAG